MRNIFARSVHTEHEVLTGNSGAGALQLVENSNPIQVLVSDHRTPGTSGSQSLQAECDETTRPRSQLLGRCLLGTIMLSGFLTPAAHAQGGPPFITDDPDTPGANNWEINAAVIGDHSHQHWDLAAPDLDINYGWGEHVQLKVDVNWASTLAADGRLIAGL